MSNFAAAMAAHLQSLPHLGIMEKRALRIAFNPDTPHNARILARWEPASAEAAGFDPSSIIDWFKANWKTILQVVLAILGFLLMFAEPPQEMGASPVEMEMDWFPGKQALLAIMPTIIDNIGLPWVRTLVGKLPLPINYNDADLKALLLQTLQESQA